MSLYNAHSVEERVLTALILPKNPEFAAIEPLMAILPRAPTAQAQS
jgi:hypothetical protein